MTEIQGASESGEKVGDESGSMGGRHCPVKASVSDEQFDLDSFSSA